jgi:hypothetical protein
MRHNEDDRGRPDATGAGHRQDEISLEGGVAQRTLPRVTGVVLAAALVFAAAWSAWGPSDASADSDQSLSAPIAERPALAMRHDQVGAAEALRRARPCFASLAVGAEDAVGAELEPTADRIDACVDYLRFAWLSPQLGSRRQAAAVTSWAESGCSLMFATADTAAHWLASGRLDHCAR